MKTMLLWMDFIIESEEKIWFPAGNYNALFCYEKNNNMIHFVNKFPISNNNNIFRLFSAGMRYKENIFFAPYHSKSIVVYNIENDTFNEISLLQKKSEAIPFRKIIKIEDYLYFISSAVKPVIVVMNIYTYQFKVYEYDVPAKISKLDFVTRDVLCENSKIFWGINKTNIIIEFDLKTTKFILREVPINDVIGTLAFYEKSFWISGKNGIYQWIHESKIVNRFIEFPSDYGMLIVYDKEKKYIEGFNEGFSKWGCPFFKSEVVNNKIIFFAAEMNMSILINPLNGKMSVFEKRSEQEKIEKSRVSVLRFLFIEKGLEGFYAYSCLDNALVHISYQGEILKKFSFEFDEKSKQRLMDMQDMIWQEKESPVLLNEWLNQVLKYKKVDKYQTNYGKKIYGKLKV